MNDTSSARLRFGVFELDPDREELRKRGLMVKLQAQPLRLLAFLARRCGELVSRDEIRRHVWGTETFVDFEQGINACVRQIRQALGDSAGSPRFVETVPRRGYRFLAPVEEVEGPGGEPRAGRRDRRRPWVLAAAAPFLAATAWVVSGWLSARDTGGVLGREPASLLLVLPFQNYSAQEAEDYLSDGMTEELITELARRYGRRLGVIARTSAMKYKGSARSVAEVAAELGADYVLEGSVRRDGGRLRVTAQLIRARDQIHLWAGNYDRELADVLAIEREVCAKIGRALALTLRLPEPEEPATSAARPAAHQAYLEGRQRLRRPWASGPQRRDHLVEARGLFERAVAVDPAFAPAWVELADVHRALEGSHEGARRAREVLDKALALDDSLAAAHLRMANLRFYYDWDLDGARRSFERALGLNPGFAEAYHDFAAWYSVTGRHDEAVALVERALHLDPLSPGVAADVGWYFYFGRRFEEALEHCRRTLETAPGYHWAEECILQAGMLGGNLDAALGQARRDMEASGAGAEELAVLERDRAEALQGYWRWRLAVLGAAASERSIPAVWLATAHMALGDRRAALDHLERAVDERNGWILPFLGVDPLFDPLRQEPRFAAILARVGIDGAD